MFAVLRVQLLCTWPAATDKKLALDVIWHARCVLLETSPGGSFSAIHNNLVHDIHCPLHMHSAKPDQIHGHADVNTGYNKTASCLLPYGATAPTPALWFCSVHSTLSS